MKRKRKEGQLQGGAAPSIEKIIIAVLMKSVPERVPLHGETENSLGLKLCENGFGGEDESFENDPDNGTLRLCENALTLRLGENAQRTPDVTLKFGEDASTKLDQKVINASSDRTENSQLTNALKQERNYVPKRRQLD